VKLVHGVNGVGQWRHCPRKNGEDECLRFQNIVDITYPLPRGGDQASLYLKLPQIQELISVLETWLETGQLADDLDIKLTLRRKEPKPYADLGDGV